MCAYLGESTWHLALESTARVLQLLSILLVERDRTFWPTYLDTGVAAE